MAFEYFTEAELRALPDMDDTTVYTAARISAAHDYVVEVIERVVGTSFTARTVTSELHDGGVYGIALERPYVLSATSATENGVAVTDDLRVRGGGVLYRFGAGSYQPGAWVGGWGNVAVTYQAGYSSTPPGDIKEAALLAAREHLLATDSTAGVDERYTQMTTEAGTATMAVDDAERPFGIPKVDAIVSGWAARLDVMGFA